MNRLLQTGLFHHRFRLRLRLGVLKYQSRLTGIYHHDIAGPELAGE
jgi:hypothetical protein